MKKAFSLILVVAMILLLVGCTGNSGNTPGKEKLKIDFPETPITLNNNAYKITSFRCEVTQQYSDGTCDIRIYYSFEYTYKPDPNLPADPAPYEKQFHFKVKLYDSEGYSIFMNNGNDIATSTFTGEAGTKVQDYIEFCGLDTNKTYTLEVKNW
ncbi:MAG: hypothetical protein IKA51_04005 [Clostridia bacterium]|nr:hypothetical protein [Clostridia bacterium]